MFSHLVCKQFKRTIEMLIEHAGLKKNVSQDRILLSEWNTNMVNMRWSAEICRQVVWIKKVSTKIEQYKKVAKK